MRNIFTRSVKTDQGQEPLVESLVNRLEAAWTADTIHKRGMPVIGVYAVMEQAILEQKISESDVEAASNIALNNVGKIFGWKI